MSEGLIISAVGRDRPGIVDRISGVVFQLGCNMEDSRMAILGGEFAVVVLVSGPTSQLEEVNQKVGELCRELELLVQFKATRLEPEELPHPGRIPYELTAVALDHPGIVHKVTNLLVRHEVNVADLETRVTRAPNSGAPIFSLELEAQVPASLSIVTLRKALQELAEAENIDFNLRAKK